MCQSVLVWFRLSGPRHAESGNLSEVFYFVSDFILSIVSDCAQNVCVHRIYVIVYIGLITACVDGHARMRHATVKVITSVRPSSTGGTEVFLLVDVQGQSSLGDLCVLQPSFSLLLEWYGRS